MRDHTYILGENARSRGWALKVLRRLELLGLQLDHARLAKAYAAFPGGWWAQVNDEPAGPYPLSTAFKLLVDGHSPVHLLHESEADQEPPPWRELRYSPIWTNRIKVLLWTVGFWMMLAFIGYAVVTSFTPVWLRSYVGVAWWLAMAGLLLCRAVAPYIARKASDEVPPESSEGRFSSPVTETLPMTD